MASWILENVEKSNRAHPDTFFIASRQERERMKVGDKVRLHFHLKEVGEGLPGAERMWVEITKRSWIGCKYTGTLTNEPEFIEDLRLGDTVTFSPEHIAQIFVPKDNPNWSPVSELSALVSKKVLEPHGIARFLYCEEPDNERDSGWRLMSGEESDDYNDNPDNITITNVGWLTDRDPSLLPILRDNKAGAVYERTGLNDPWKAVTDWAPLEE